MRMCRRATADHVHIIVHGPIDRFGDTLVEPVQPKTRTMYRSASGATQDRCRAGRIGGFVVRAVDTSCRHSRRQNPAAVPIHDCVPVAVEGILDQEPAHCGDVRVVCVPTRSIPPFTFAAAARTASGSAGAVLVAAAAGETPRSVFSGGADNRKVRSRNVRSRRRPTPEPQQTLNAHRRPETSRINNGYAACHVRVGRGDSVSGLFDGL